MRTLKWCLIGAGDIVRKRVAPALRDSPGMRVRGGRAGERGAGRDVCGRVRRGDVYADWRDMIVDPAIDAVYVATPVHLHAEQTIAAAEAGKHVLCEKPMGLDVAECDRMIAACRAHGVLLGIAYYRHFYPLIQRMKGLLDDGRDRRSWCTRRSTRSSGSICRPTIHGPGFCNASSQGADRCSISAAIVSRS